MTSIRKRRPRILRTLAIMVPFLLTIFLTLGVSTDAFAIRNGNGYSTTTGFDMCPLPSVSQMQTWRYYSPYYWYSVYIGGDNATCPPGNISSWLNQVNGQGWNFEYTWVGPQPPCSGYSNIFSSTPSTAYNEGWNEAGAAVSQLETDGVTNSASATPLIYDLETAGNGSCQAAINSFIQGWVDYLNTAPAQIPGVYGSVCNSNLGALASLSPPPSFIWGAYYDGNPDTADLSAGGCGVPNGDWTNQQRLKQYDHNYTTPPYGGLSLTVDQDCANSITTPSGLETSNCN